MAIVSIGAAGAMYLLSNIFPSLKVKAKDRIKGALLGILLLFLIYSIITVINPSLENFNINKPLTPSPTTTEPVKSPPGLYLYTADNCPATEKNPLYLSENKYNFGSLSNSLRSAKIVHGDFSAYVSILYDVSGYCGRCLYLDPNIECQSILWPGPFSASAAVYQYDFFSAAGSVTFFRKPFYNEQGGWKRIPAGMIDKLFDQPLSSLFFDGDGEKCTVPEEDKACLRWDINGKTCLKREDCPNLSGENINSIKMTSNFIVLLLKADPTDGTRGSVCQLFPAFDDLAKTGPLQLHWEYVRNQKALPDWVTIIPVVSN
ncbi:hypothetical protein KKG36_01310 [Patescibacteria group bacterium]|nr:hypothetical protein [Patescibacteria group bacterium]